MKRLDCVHVCSLSVRKIVFSVFDASSTSFYFCFFVAKVVLTVWNYQLNFAPICLTSAGLIIKAEFFLPLQY